MIFLSSEITRISYFNETYLIIIILASQVA